MNDFNIGFIGLGNVGSKVANNIIKNGDPVTGHGSGVHASPIMIAGSNNVFVGGVAVCNAGDLATCGHPATGSSNVNVGD